MASLQAQVMDDLCTRFVINIQDEEIEDPIRVFFVLEQAHWYYEDFFRKQHPALPRMSLRDFAFAMFKHYKPFHRFKGKIDEFHTAFKKYKKGVPVCGALMLNATCTKVLMVRGWGINVWSFPKGKINENEVLVDCAIREVEEETGYNFASLADPAAFVEIMQEKKPMTLFIVTGVPEDFPFAPLSRNEVSEIKFVKIAKLVDAASAKKMNVVNICPQIIGKLKAWLSTPAGKAAKKQAMQRAGITAAAEESPVAAPAAPQPSLNDLLKVLQGGGTAGGVGAGAAEPSTTSPDTGDASVTASPEAALVTSGGLPIPEALRPTTVGVGSPSMLNFSFDIPAIMRPFANERDAVR